MRARSGWVWLALWAALVVVALGVRPLLPIDETRYLSVAWEMWRRHDWLVPYLNGAPYSDKPPLLFWSMLLGWRVLGVTEWWPRLLSPLFALASVLLLARLARRLAPERPDAAGLAIPLMSGMLWVTYSTAVLFDALLAMCVLLALSGVVEAWRGRPKAGWLIYGVGLGLGGLAKGPVVLVHTLPVALLAPWWTTAPRPARWRGWYVGVLAGVALGVAIGLAWALTAAHRAGPAYEAAILWGQTAGRVANAFAHRRPWWWYLPLLPVLLFPWVLWPPLWRALASTRRTSVAPVRFALACVVPAFVVFSLISGKQVHYLLPLLPAFALLVAFALLRTDAPARRRDAVVPAAVLGATGVLSLAVAGLVGTLHLPGWATVVAVVCGIVLLAGAIVLALLPVERHLQIAILSCVTPALLIAVHLAARPVPARTYDLQPMALLLKGAEQSHRPIAYVGRYAGQFHFLGRLEHRLDEVAPEQLPAWASAHPAGLVVRFARSSAAPLVADDALVTRPYRDGVIGVWTASRAVCFDLAIQRFRTLTKKKPAASVMVSGPLATCNRGAA